MSPHLIRTLLNNSHQINNSMAHVPQSSRQLRIAGQGPGDPDFFTIADQIRDSGQGDAVTLLSVVQPRGGVVAHCPHGRIISRAWGDRKREVGIRRVGHCLHRARISGTRFGAHALQANLYGSRWIGETSAVLSSPNGIHKTCQGKMELVRTMLCPLPLATRVRGPGLP